MAIALTLCFVDKLGPAAHATALARQTAPELPALVAEFWVDSPPLSLDKLGGKAVLIGFGDQLAPGASEIGERLKRCQQRYGSLGLIVIGVHRFDGTAAGQPDLRRKLTKRRLKIPIVIDAGGQIHTQYGESPLPFLVLVGPERRILYRQSGPLADFDELELQVRLALER